jgi:hypothetical protein
MLHALTVEFNQDSAVLQFCTLNLSTTDNTSRCEAALVLNDSINGFPVRQEELGSSFGLAQSYPGNLTLYHGTLTGSNDFTTYFGHVSGTPENDLDADNWYHTVVWVPIPEPSSLILYVIVGTSVRKILRQCK